MNPEQDTIASLQSHIKDLEQEIRLTKQMANRLLARKGQPPLYNDADEAGESGSLAALRSDQFYRVPIFTAMREYLKMRRSANLGPATVNEIYDALCKGGMKFDTEDVGNRKRNLRISLSKNSGVFHRMPNGNQFALTEWYGDSAGAGDDEVAPKRPPKKKAKRVKAAKAPAGKVEKPKDGDGDNLTAAQSKAMTLMQAVKLGIEAMNGEFTKQNVLDWIKKNHPQVRAEKPSVFTSINKFKDSHGLVKVKEPIGSSEPHVFRKETVASNGKK